ncbi:hypothetical protein PanWU01x14_315220, partial [Parasponia andersonii]
HHVIDDFVEFVVHMVNKTCNNRKGELDLILTLVSTYDGLMHPVENKSEWEVPDNIREAIVTKPNEEKAKADRPKKHKIKSADCDSEYIEIN